MNVIWLIPALLLMAWFVWKFVSGFWKIKPDKKDMEAGSRSDGTWFF
jgi:hypothetical protein